MVCKHAFPTSGLCFPLVDNVIQVTKILSILNVQGVSFLFFSILCLAGRIHEIIAQSCFVKVRKMDAAALGIQRGNRIAGGGRQQQELETHRPNAGVLTRCDGAMIGIGTLGEQEPCTGNGTLPIWGTTVCGDGSSET